MLRLKFVPVCLCVYLCVSVGIGSGVCGIGGYEALYWNIQNFVISKWPFKNKLSQN